MSSSIQEIRRLLLLISLTTCGFPFALVARGEEPSAPSAEQVEFFELKIRPLLAEKCTACHDGSSSAESTLALTSRAALIKGGEFGPALIPNKAEQSLLYQAVRRVHKELRMPPEENEKLNEEQLADVRRWIELGAPWPAGDKAEAQTATAPAAAKPLTTTHWAFLPYQKPALPEVADPAWRGNPIDRFLQARREQLGAQPVEMADRRTMIRRVSYDLIGLPPARDEIEAFCADPAPDDEALARLVDRLLASPQYGERWGRHWLDVARYADTQGDTGDFPIPEAYRYRNWVIDALNQDLPYNEFVVRQLAGDILAKQESDAEQAVALKVATGFLALSRRFGNDQKESLHLTIEDSIDTIGRGLMGVTLRCARCHDHKFDPMLATDYYGLYGILESTQYPWMGMSDFKSPSQLAAASQDPEDQRKLDEYWKTIDRYEYQINNHFRPWLKPTLDEFHTVSQELESTTLDDVARQRFAERREALLSTREGKFRELMLHGLDWLRKEKKRLAESPPTLALFAVREGRSHDARLHRRGNPDNLGEVVPRRFVQIVSVSQTKIATGASGRLEFAQWLTSPDHPLTARVIVNRVWQHHFGRGIVETVSNFGVQGSAPTHAELLNYLAAEFVEQGWSLKKLHREILLSRSYRLASGPHAKNQELDPENRLLWRYTRQRLDAEAIRDSLLCVTGELDRTHGGAHPFPAWHTKSYNLNAPFVGDYDTRLRSVYLMTARQTKQPFLELFDGADPNATTGQRTTANTPAQALYLLNGKFMADRSAALARRVEDASTDDAGRIDLLFEFAFGRHASTAERSAIEQFLINSRAAFAEVAADSPAANTPQASSVWAALARVILASNEFFYVD